MSTISPLQPADFPIIAIGQYVYRRSASSPFVGPVAAQLAFDIAFRLNRDHQTQTGARTVTTFFAAQPSAEGGEHGG